MIIGILTVHIPFSEVATLILKDFAIHGEYLRKQADLRLFLKLVGRVAIDEDSFSGSVGMQIEEAEVFVLMMEMKDHFLDCVDRRVSLWIGVDIASVEVDAVGINSICTSCNTIGIEDWKDVEDESIPKQTSLITVFG